MAYFSVRRGAEEPKKPPQDFVDAIFAEGLEEGCLISNNKTTYLLGAALVIVPEVLGNVFEDSKDEIEIVICVDADDARCLFREMRRDLERTPAHVQ